MLVHKPKKFAAEWTCFGEKALNWEEKDIRGDGIYGSHNSWKNW